MSKQQTTDQQGLVISYFGNSVAVEVDNEQVFQCHLRRNQDLPVVGDQVLWHLESADSGVITQILPRRSLLSRGDGHHKAKPIAANIDIILIVMAPPPIFSEYLVDRYVAAAELVGISPVLVLNKADLLTDQAFKTTDQRLQFYRDIPYPVILSSAITKDGLAELANHLQNKTAVLVGPSGVGKSSIIAALGNLDAIRIGDVTAKGAGKHTTTATRLYHLPQGGNLIDSPGVREFNLWPVTKKEILRSFKEFNQFLNGCKFRDCTHLVEPGCMVREALQAGKISAERYSSFQNLMKEAIPETKHGNSR